MGDNSFFNDEWVKVQQRYWEGLAGLTDPASAADAGENPWEAALDGWWSRLSSVTSDPARGYVEKMIEQGKQLFRLAGSLTSRLGEDDASAAWQEAIDQALHDLHRRFLAEGQGARDLAAAQVAIWQQMATAFASLSAGFSSLIPEQILSTPGFASGRQASEATLAEAVADYQQALQAYGVFFSGFGAAAVERLQQQLQSLADSGDKVTSARALYDQWVAACEAVYSEQVMTKEYSRLHGELTNKLMRVRQAIGEQMDQTLHTFGIPSREEVRTLQRRAQADRRELRLMQGELAALKSRIDGMQPAANRAAAGAGVKRARVKKKTAKKKVVKNKVTARRTPPAGDR